MSITDLFKGIFDYASKKIVTNRIKNKTINKITGNILWTYHMKEIMMKITIKYVN